MTENENGHDSFFYELYIYWDICIPCAIQTVFNYYLNRHCPFKTQISLLKVFLVRPKIFLPLPPSILIQFIFTGQIKDFPCYKTLFDPLDKNEFKISGENEKEVTFIECYYVLKL